MFMKKLLQSEISIVLYVVQVLPHYYSWAKSIEEGRTRSILVEQQTVNGHFTVQM